MSEIPVGQEPGRVHGVLVTFRRPEWLRTSLETVARQSLQLASLTVVDNAPDEDNARLVNEESGGSPVHYIASPSNLGPAGGLASGMQAVLAVADDSDWILLLDDDDPPKTDSIVEELVTFAETVRRDREMGGVGVSGARLDRRRGRLVRPANQELTGVVPIDYVGGNQLPLYSVRAVRAVGVPEPRLFFGFDDLEIGLRLAEGGFPLFTSGVLHHRARSAASRLDLDVKPTRALDGPPTWRRYYSLRNLVWILDRRGLRRQALTVALNVGVLKPIRNLPRHPVWTVQHLRANVRAVRDGFADRLGLTVPPG